MFECISSKGHFGLSCDGHYGLSCDLIFFFFYKPSSGYRPINAVQRFSDDYLQGHSRASVLSSEVPSSSSSHKSTQHSTDRIGTYISMHYQFAYITSKFSTRLLKTQNVPKGL